MRELTYNEMTAVSGAENLDVTVIDPVAAIQTFLFLISYTDQQSFIYGSVVTGMTGGAITGGIMGYGAVAGMGMAAGIGAGVACAGAGAIAGGLAAKGAATFMAGAYNWIMG